MIWLVIYDIGDDRRRGKLYRALHGYGVPVQRSVFHCPIDASKLPALRRTLARHVRPEEADKVLLLPLCSTCERTAEVLAGPPLPRKPGLLLV